MFIYLEKRQRSFSCRIFSVVLSIILIFQLIISPAAVLAQNLPYLPNPGTMVNASPAFTPVLVKGLTIYPQNPLQFDFIVDSGDEKINDNDLKTETNRLIKYFLASLTVPEEQMWVNLSPYEKDRIIPEGLGVTELGRDLLAQDYLLKQLAASLIYPEKDLGRKFWDRVYRLAKAKYKTTEIPVNTFNKVWIVPDKATVYEHGSSAFVVESHLKVMLEEDYVALNKTNINALRAQRGASTEEARHQTQDLSKRESSTPGLAGSEPSREDTSKLGSDIIREIIIPEIEKEINTGHNFALLRQIYHAMVLATWYKQNLRQGLLGQVYVDQNKISGIDLNDKNVKQKIYDQYLAAFKKGVYNFIKEDVDPATAQTLPRKYFSGGAVGFKGTQLRVVRGDQAMLSPLVRQSVQPHGRQRKITWAAVENASTQQLDAAMLAGGPAYRFTGQKLTPQQHDLVNEVIATYFPGNKLQGGRWVLPMTPEFQLLDPQQKLQQAGVRIFFLPGMMLKIHQLAMQKGIAEPPVDLVSHPGRLRRHVYIDPVYYESFLKTQSAEWLGKWAEHELAEIEDAEEVVVPSFSPPVVPVLAPPPVPAAPPVPAPVVVPVVAKKIELPPAAAPAKETPTGQPEKPAVTPPRDSDTAFTSAEGDSFFTMSDAENILGRFVTVPKEINLSTIRVLISQLYDIGLLERVGTGARNDAYRFRLVRQLRKAAARLADIPAWLNAHPVIQTELSFSRIVEGRTELVTELVKSWMRGLDSPNPPAIVPITPPSTSAPEVRRQANYTLFDALLDLMSREKELAGKTKPPAAPAPVAVPVAPVPAATAAAAPIAAPVPVAPAAKVVPAAAPAATPVVPLKIPAPPAKPVRIEAVPLSLEQAAGYLQSILRKHYQAIPLKDALRLKVFLGELWAKIAKEKKADEDVDDTALRILKDAEPAHKAVIGKILQEPQALLDFFKTFQYQIALSAPAAELHKALTKINDGSSQSMAITEIPRLLAHYRAFQSVMEIFGYDFAVWRKAVEIPLPPDTPTQVTAVLENRQTLEGFFAASGITGFAATAAVPASGERISAVLAAMSSGKTPSPVPAVPVVPRQVTARPNSSALLTIAGAGEVIVSPGGRFVLATFRRGPPQLVDLATGKDPGIQLQTAGEPDVIGGTFSADDKHLLVWYSYGPARVWDLEKRTERVDIKTGVNELSPVFKAHLYRKYSRNPKELANQVQRAQGVRVGKFSLDGQRFYVQYENSFFRAFDVPTGQPLGPEITTKERAQFSRDGKFLKLWPKMTSKTVSRQLPVEVLDLHTGQKVAEPAGAFNYESNENPRNVPAVGVRHDEFDLLGRPAYRKLSPDGQWVVFSDHRTYVGVFDVATKQRLPVDVRSVLDDQTEFRVEAVFSRERSRLLLNLSQYRANPKFKEAGFVRRPSLLVRLDSTSPVVQQLPRKSVLSPDGEILFLITNREDVQKDAKLSRAKIVLLDEQRSIPFNVPSGLEVDISRTSFTWDNQRLLVGYEDGSLDVFRVDSITAAQDPAMLASGPAYRWLGQDLDPEQHQLVDDAIATYFDGIKLKTGRRLLPRDEEYKILDPEGVLSRAAVLIFFLPGLTARMLELAQQRGMNYVPLDMISHPGRNRRFIYVDPAYYEAVLKKQSRGWLADWARHELADIEQTEFKAEPEVSGPVVAAGTSSAGPAISRPPDVETVKAVPVPATDDVKPVEKPPADEGPVTLQSSIRELELALHPTARGRVFGSLEISGIRLIADLTQRTERDLLTIDRVTEDVVAQLKTGLAKHGWSFKADPITLESSVDRLKISGTSTAVARALNTLQGVGINTIADLTRQTKNELSRLKWISLDLVQAIREALWEAGQWTLKGDEALGKSAPSGPAADETAAPQVSSELTAGKIESVPSGTVTLLSSIRDLNLGNQPIVGRLYKALEGAGIVTVDDLRKKTAAELSAIDRVGPGALVKIREQLWLHGQWTLKGEGTAVATAPREAPPAAVPSPAVKATVAKTTPPVAAVPALKLSTRIEVMHRDEGVHDVVVSPSGNYLLFINGDFKASYIWNLRTNTRVELDLREREGIRIQGGEFSADDSFLAVRYETGPARVWDMTSLKERADIKIGFSEISARLLTILEEKYGKGTPAYAEKVAAAKGIWRLSISMDGNRLYVRYRSDRGKVFDLRTGKQVGPGIERHYRTIFSRDGRYLKVWPKPTAGGKSQAYYLDVENGEQLEKNPGAGFLDFFQDGNPRLFPAQPVRRYHWNTPAEVTTWRVSQDGAWAVFSDGKSYLAIYNLAQRKAYPILQDLFTGGEDAQVDATFARSGQVLIRHRPATAEKWPAGYLYDLNQPLSQQPNVLPGASWLSTSGRFVFVGGETGSQYPAHSIIDLENNRTVVLPLKDKPIFYAEFSDDASRLVIFYESREIEVVDLTAFFNPAAVIEEVSAAPATPDTTKVAASPAAVEAPAKPVAAAPAVPKAVEQSVENFDTMSFQAAAKGNYMDFVNSLIKWFLARRNQLSFLKPVYPFPAEQPLKLEDVVERNGSSLYRLLNTVSPHGRQGAQFIFKGSEKGREKLVVVRFLRKGEDVNVLHQESLWRDYWRRIKFEKNVLTAEYGKTVLLDQQRVIRMKVRDTPSKLAELMRLRQDNSVVLDTTPVSGSEEEYKLTVFEVESDESLKPLAEARNIQPAVENTVHDLFYIARQGLVLPRVIQLSSQSSVQGGKHPLWWMAEALLNENELQFAPRTRLSAFEESLRGIRLGATGPAELNGFVSLTDLLEPGHPRTAFMSLNSLSSKNRAKMLMAHFLGNYLLAAALSEASHLRDQGKLPPRNTIAVRHLRERLKSIYIEAAKAFLQGDTRGEVTPLVNWDEMATQIIDLMTTEDESARARQHLPPTLIKANYVFTYYMVERFAAEQAGKPGTVPADKAMLAGAERPVVQPRNVGGINLDASLLNLQIRRDGQGIPLPLLQQPFQNMKIDGFAPLIINIAPVNVPLMLGMVSPEPKADDSVSWSDSDPVDIRQRTKVEETAGLSFLN